VQGEKIVPVSRQYLVWEPGNDGASNKKTYTSVGRQVWKMYKCVRRFKLYNMRSCSHKKKLKIKNCSKAQHLPIAALCNSSQSVPQNVTCNNISIILSFFILYHDTRASTTIASTYRLYIQPPHRMTAWQ
jgi:hypothetical protein